MVLRIGCIVEGHGEIEAVPILIRRIAALEHSTYRPELPPPIRKTRGSLIQQGGLEGAVDLAVAKVKSRGAVLVLIDSDDDCPKHLAPRLLARARKQRSDLPIGVVLAKFEFEAWFLAAADSLRDRDPEEIRGAKEWLKNNLLGGRKYRETVDQAALTQQFDIEKARRRSPSFDKCYREIARLFDELIVRNLTG